MSRRPTSVLAALALTAGLAVATASPAAASHPCHENDRCEGHWCIGLYSKPPYLLYPC